MSSSICDEYQTKQSAEHLMFMCSVFGNTRYSLEIFCVCNNLYEISRGRNKTYLKQLSAFIKTPDLSF